MFASLLRGGGAGETPPPLPKKGGNENEDRFDRFLKHAAALPAFPWKEFLGITVALYILNQSHLLPKPLSGLVSRVLFWPTLPITVGKRFGNWKTEIDETVILGGAPFGFMGLPDQLYEEGVRGVINMCEEYKGPCRSYKKLGMSELRLPTTDHFEPSVHSLQSAVEFIEQHAKKGERVYVHCRAGHGRSAAAVMAWKISQNPLGDVHTFNDELCQKRNVRKTLWKQPQLQQFHQRLLEEMRDDTSDNLAASDETHQVLLEQQRDDTGANVAASSDASDNLAASGETHQDLLEQQRDDIGANVEASSKL
jgi:atypical dual specificity phosphatase